VGRSLGTRVGAEIRPSAADIFGYVVQAACLAHDIGNPPFGHAGEYAIQSWFEKETKPDCSLAVKLANTRQTDFTLFDGNAQGFRIITQLEDSKWIGGLQLTHAVLGAFTKYPRASHLCCSKQKEKPGFFKSEEPYFVEVADDLGLRRRGDGDPSWCRHPLALLVEAADDICYRIIDIEDGYELDYLTFTETKDFLGSIASHDPKFTKLPAHESDQIGKLRGVAVGVLIEECVRVFVDNQEAILAGCFDTPLLDKTIFSRHMKTAKQLATEKIFHSLAITKREIAGSTIIAGLLDIFVDAVNELREKNFDMTKLDKKAERVIRMIGKSLRRASDMYDAMLCVTDRVSGMTDRLAVETYRALKGISI
jgi:dGTPase